MPDCGDPHMLAAGGSSFFWIAASGTSCLPRNDGGKFECVRGMTLRYINPDAFVVTFHVIAKEGTLCPTVAIHTC